MRLVRTVLGGEIDRRVLPVVAVSFTYSASFSTFWVYVGIFAVKGLHWPVNRVGLLFLLSAPVAAVANYLSGHVSDRIGRKGLIVASFLASATNAVALALLGHRTAIAFMTGPAWTLAPFIAFQLRAHGGVASVWVFFAAVALAGAVAGAAAARVAGSQNSRPAR